MISSGAASIGAHLSAQHVLRSVCARHVCAVCVRGMCAQCVCAACVRSVWCLCLEMRGCRGRSEADRVPENGGRKPGIGGGRGGRGLFIGAVTSWSKGTPALIGIQVNQEAADFSIQALYALLINRNVP